MTPFVVTDQQRQLIQRPIKRRLFLEGPAGTGKTTAGVGRLLHLLESGVPGGSILVIVPQRTLASPYYEALRQSSVRAGGQVTVLTVGGLAQRTVDLFWPLVAEDAGFGHPDDPPTFLTLETAQYYMARLVRPLLDQGYFETITINRNRLYSQIIDNLNKAAVVGFPYTQIGKRLKAAWSGEQSQRRIYDEAQACATRFRQYCLAHNLLDFSLQLEVFLKYLWAMPLCRNYLLETYSHLFVDNVEEDTPVAHDLLRDWLPHCRSALLIYDQGAGYRRFLAADPESGRALRDLCDERVVFSESYVTSPDVRAFGDQLARSLNRSAQAPLPGTGRGRGRGLAPLPAPGRDRGRGLAPLPTPGRGRGRGLAPLPTPGKGQGRGLAPLPTPGRGQGRGLAPLPAPGRGRGRGPGNAREALVHEYHRYYPEMLDWVADEIAGLVHDESVPPGEIVVLSPFLPDVLRFSLMNRLMNRLDGRDVPARSHRPSRALRDEPATQCLLTLAAIAHPEWRSCPSPFDVAYALMQAIDGLDLVRAQLLTRIVYRSAEGRPTLTSFDQIIPEMKERLTFVLGERYEHLRTWIENYIATSSPLHPPPQDWGGPREAAPTPGPSPNSGGGESFPPRIGEARVGVLPPQDWGGPRGGVEFDFFLSRLFGEVLSQAGFGFHHNYDAGKVAANLIESVRKFRWVTQPSRRLGDTGSETDSAQDAASTGSSSAATCGRVALGQEYIEMVQDGVIAAQYVHSWQLQPEDAVLLAPAYTFLMSNRPVDYQFWLDVGSRGWWERLYQPLTQPYVLSRGWPRDAIWTDADEHEARQETLHRLTQGLIRRCRCKVYMGLSGLGENGREQKGRLLQVIQRILRRL